MVSTTELLPIVLGYLGSLLLGIVVIIFLQRGFFGPWLRVKASRGAKVLVRVLSMSDDYYKVGRVDEGILVFKDRLKERRRVTIPPAALYRSLGVDCLDLDDERNTVFDRKAWTIVSGFDGKKYDALYERILMRPGKKDILVLIILVIVMFVLLVSLYNAYTTYKISAVVNTLAQVSKAAITPGA